MEDAQNVITVGSVADCIKGEILNSTEKTGEVVESFMVGAMCVDPSPLYFGIRSNKAVITRGDRPDIQLGALETSTRCLVVTGGTRPIPSVIQHAEEKGIPILLVEKDTLVTLTELEEGLGLAITEESKKPQEAGDAGEKVSPDAAAEE